jgi:hypothetical protein
MLDRRAARPSTAPGPGPRAGRCAAPTPRTANARCDPGPIVDRLPRLGWGRVHDASRPGGSGAGMARRGAPRPAFSGQALRAYSPGSCMLLRGWPSAPAFSRPVRCIRGGEGSGGVAGVVTERRGEVDGPGAAEHADDQVAQASHVCGRAGPNLGSVLGEGDVADVVQAVLAAGPAPRAGGAGRRSATLRLSTGHV